MGSIDQDPIKSFKSPAAFESWLRKHHDTSTGIWLRIYKKASGKATVTYADALDVALCHGWIDGQKRKYDEVSFLQRFTPRRARSAWSRINVGHVARLTREGRMQPAGIAAFEAARADGRVQRAYDSPATSRVPEDFLHELRKNHDAFKFYETLNRANQYAIAYRLANARRPETRERRMQQFLAMMAARRKIHE